MNDVDNDKEEKLAAAKKKYEELKKKQKKKKSKKSKVEGEGEGEGEGHEESTDINEDGGKSGGAGEIGEKSASKDEKERVASNETDVVVSESMETGDLEDREGEEQKVNDDNIGTAASNAGSSASNTGLSASNPDPSASNPDNIKSNTVNLNSKAPASKSQENQPSVNIAESTHQGELPPPSNDESDVAPFPEIQQKQQNYSPDAKIEIERLKSRIYELEKTVKSLTLENNRLKSLDEDTEDLAPLPLSPSENRNRFLPKQRKTSFVEVDLYGEASKISDIRKQMEQWKGWQVDMRCWRSQGIGPVFDI